MSGERKFLSRWSARKQEARATDDAQPREGAIASAAEPAVAPEELETLSDEELCERLGLPDPETLKEGDDFKVFLDSRVPERLRRVALRRLWRSDPFFNMRDGLDDYDEDYRALHASADAVRTLYRVGEGFAKSLSGAAEASATVEATGGGEETPIEKNAAARDICASERDSVPLEESPPQFGEAAEPSDSGAGAAKTECGRPSQITSRRMAFRFVEKPNTDG